MRAHNLLANGTGGIDWAGLPLVAAYLGVQQLEPFIDALEAVLTHQPDASGKEEEEPDE